MHSLKLATSLSVPPSILTQTLALLGIKGSGKTHNAMVLVEEFLGQGLPVVVVDPVGVCWGLRASADGKGPGLPIVVMGGEHGDVPLAVESGHIVAQLVATEGVSAVLDLSLMRKGEQRRFVMDFAEELYHKNRRPMHLVLDEADLFAPQKPMKGQERLLGAIEDLVRRGRARGIGVTMATQRAAVLNKDVLSQTEILMAMRMIGARDRDAIDQWIEAKGTPEKRDEVMKSLASMKNGEAWFWSPTFLDIFKKVQVRKRSTYDSSKTPEIGEVIRAPKRLAPVDLEKIRVQMASAIAQAKQEDPKLLKARILDLERQISEVKRARPAPPPPAPRAYVGKTVVKRIVLRTEGLERLMVQSDRVSQRLERLIGKYDGRLGELLKVARAASAPPAPSKSVEHRLEVQIPREVPFTERQFQTLRAMPGKAPDGKAEEVGPLVRGEKKMLNALRMFFPKPLNRNQVGLLVGLPAKGTTYMTYLNRLKRRKYIYEDSHGIGLSHEGMAVADEPTKVAATAQDVREIWSQRLVAGEREILDLVMKHPGVSREAIAHDMAINPTGTTLATYVNRMKRVGLIVERDKALYPSEDLFVGA